MHKLKSYNPSNYQLLGEVEISTLEDIKHKIALAHQAKQAWRDLGLAKRIALLQKVMDEFKTRKAEYALLQSREMGMPIDKANDDVDGGVANAEWYFANAQKYLAPETTFENDAEIHQVHYEPYGVMALITPWNFPFSNVIWGGLQSLIAGNTIVLKHSEECPLCGKFIEEVFSRHLPPGVFNEVYGDGTAGQQLVQQDINMLAFIGSTKTGKLLYEQAAQKFIKADMELGGSAPGILFADADLDIAINGACEGRLYNCGQCCDGLKRLIVHEDIFDDVVSRIAKNFAAKKIGVAEATTTEIGPLVAKRQLDLLIAQVEEAKQKGATVVCGGQSLEKKLTGAFFEPTVLTGVTAEMRVWKEEVFGPVLPIVKFSTEQEAIELANQTSYGLGAYLFTEDKNRAERVARLIESGMVSINGVSYIKPCNPFGGYKNSGFGREHGRFGFHEKTQVKVIAKMK